MERKRKNILIVDDSRVKQYLIKSLLEKKGYSVHCADTVSSASKIIGTMDIGTVLVDFTLAGYNNGIVLVKKIKHYNVNVNIYAISSTAEYNEQLLAAGCNGIISNDVAAIKNFFKDYSNKPDT